MTTETSKLSFSNVINGSLRSGSETTYGTNPRTGESSWAVPIASREDLTEAVKAASNAFQAWSRTEIKERQQVLLKLADVLMAKKELMSSIISRETGKSKFMSDLEVEHSANFLQFNASQSLPDDIVHEDTEMKIVSTHTPLGIVGAICPWNFPLVLATGKIAASLLMGNCVIVKPSPFTPYSVLKFAELAIGTVSAGVFQALNGNNQLGEWMTVHPQIDKISFTGSTGTGRKIMESCSKTLKRITLELGGNDATIVLPDVSVERVAPQVAAGCFFNAGQMCVATKRVYVHEGIYEEFKRTFVEEVQALWRGRHEDNSIIGPLQNSMQYSVVRNLIQDSEAKGYIVALGGSDMAPTGAGAGFFVAPTVLDNPPDSPSVAQEEQFGPVIPLLSWKTVDEVVTRANDTVAGLGAYVWAEDVEEAERIGRRLEAGSLWLNSYEKPLPMGYFSGHKQSGIGGEWGKQGLLAYCNTQSIHIYKSH